MKPLAPVISVLPDIDAGILEADPRAPTRGNVIKAAQ